MGRGVILVATAALVAFSLVGCSKEATVSEKEAPVAKTPDVTAEEAIKNVQKSSMTPEQKAMTEAMIRGRAKGEKGGG